MEPRAHDVLLGGHEFHWTEWGDPADPPIVFLHGVLTNSLMYSPLLERLAAAGRRVIALDQRGHGASAHTGDYRPQSFVDDLTELWDALGLGSMDVVGHSMGAGHATAFAAEHPDAVARLALLDMPFWCEYPPEDELPYWMACAGLAPEDGFDSPDSYLAAAAQAFPRSNQDAISVNLRDLEQGEDGRWRWRRPPDVGVFARPKRSDDEWRAIVAEVSCPVLIARAVESEVFAESAAELARAFSDATAVEIPGSGHMVMWENVEGWADATLAFLAADSE